jgi:hypothetical protein
MYNMARNRQHSFTPILISILIMNCRISIYGSTSSTKTETILFLPSPLPTPKRAHSDFCNAWENSTHAYTYALEKGPNTCCAGYHSPANWNPAATINEPPNCVSCKFPFETEPRVADGNHQSRRSFGKTSPARIATT